MIDGEAVLTQVRQGKVRPEWYVLHGKREYFLFIGIIETAFGLGVGAMLACLIWFLLLAEGDNFDGTLGCFVTLFFLLDVLLFVLGIANIIQSFTAQS
jgi:hypothetical protein